LVDQSVTAHTRLRGNQSLSPVASLLLTTSTLPTTGGVHSSYREENRVLRAANMIGIECVNAVQQGNDHQGSYSFCRTGPPLSLQDLVSGKCSAHPWSEALSDVSEAEAGVLSHAQKPYPTLLNDLMDLLPVRVCTDRKGWEQHVVDGIAMSEVKFLDHGRTSNCEGTPPVWLR